MTGKPRKPKKGLAEPETAYRHAPAEEDGHENYVPEDEMDAYLWRNRHAINASIREGREQFARGECRTLDEVMAEMKARAAERIRKRKASPK